MIRPDRGAAWRKWKRRVVLPILGIGIALVSAAIGFLSQQSLATSEGTSAQPPDLAKAAREGERFIRKYFELPTMEQRAQWATSPVQTLAAMRRHYRVRELEKPILTEIRLEGERTTKNRHYYLFRATDASAEVHHLSLTKEEGRWMLDWQAYSGANPVSWNAYRRDRPTNPMVFRVNADLADYYNHVFADDQRWLCVNLRNAEGLVEVHGYVERRSLLANQLTQILRGRRAVPMMLRLQWPAESPADHQVRIVGFVQRGWHTQESSE